MLADPTVREWVTTGALGLGLLIVVIVAAYAAYGLFQARSLVRRELAAYFLSPIAYVVFVVFLAATGFLFAGTVEQMTTSGPEGVEFPLRFMYGDERFWLVFLFIPPLLTMRSFAEERASGTLEMLMTAPLRDWQVVLAKYTACFLFYLLLWVPTLAYLPLLLRLQVESADVVITAYSILFAGGLAAALFGLVLLVPRLGTRMRLVSLILIVGGLIAAVIGGRLHYEQDGAHLLEISAGVDPGTAVTFYLGVALAGALFLALGLFVSSLVRDQLVAALIALALGLVFIVASFWQPDLDRGTTLDSLVYYFSVPLHFSRAFTRGLLDTGPLVLYSSVALFFLFLTVRSLEGRRWR
jgi:gliding motility-associated transport system permease protein